MPTHDAVEGPGRPTHAAALLLGLVREFEQRRLLAGTCRSGLDLRAHELEDRWPTTPHALRVEVVDGPALDFRRMHVGRCQSVTPRSSAQLDRLISLLLFGPRGKAPSHLRA